MKSQKIISVPLVSLTLSYLALPLVIFFCGWLKPGYAILAIAPLLLCGWRLIREWPAEPFSFQLREAGIVVVLSFALTAFVGIGAFGFQDYDWIKHNAVLFDCVNLPWPVSLTDGTTEWPLVYYLAYYLPAAVVGKIGAEEVKHFLGANGRINKRDFYSMRRTARLDELPATVKGDIFNRLDHLSSPS